MKNVREKIKVKSFRFLILPFWLLLFTSLNYAQTLAPGAPGKDAQWSTAGKQAIGTSFNTESKVWFTLAEGALTEVYYPDVTVANVHKLEFVVVNPKTKKVETETEDAIHKIECLTPENNPRTKDYHSQSSYSLSFKQTNTAKSGEWKIIKNYITDVNSDVVLIDVQFETKNKDAVLYVYYDPSIGNTGMHDTSWTQDGIMMASDKNKISALAFSFGRKSPNQFQETTNGFFGVSDGLTQLKQTGEIKEYTKAENGNVVQLARIPFDSEDWTPVETMGGGPKSDNKFTIALGFGETAKGAIDKVRQSLFKGFERARYEYELGWNDYIKTIPKVEPKYQAQFNMAAMVLKEQEDKTVRGANVASLTIPWGGGANANEDIGGGYHLVWSRDLYQVVTAYMALGDTAAANRALDFLFDIQQKPDGSFPQNSWLDGKQGWGSLQLDEVAYPLIMAYQLKRFDKKLYENHVKKAADFLVKTGPKTTQERWEEKSGYSPSTIAAEIAGLVCAADIAKRNGDEISAHLYLKTADDWQSNVEKWTATTNGKYGDGNYYVRLTENGKPDAKEKTVLSNNAGTAIENEIVDAGFLELVRLGIKSPDDPLIQKSVKVIDQTLRVVTPNGESFYRYTNDGYGEMDDGRRWNWDGKYTGKGRLWALLAGERGQYELAMDENWVKEEKEKRRLNPDYPVKKTYREWRVKANSRLEAMANFANEGLMIPEQIWDKAETPKNIDKQFVPELEFGEGTGSATPLAWSMAQFIRLAVNLQAGKNLDTPDIVYNRYVLGKKENAVNNLINETPVSFQIPPKDIEKFFQNSKVVEKTAQQSQQKKGLSLEYNLRPKNQKFANFSINWDCEEKWGAANPSFEKVAERVVKNGNIEFFQCSSGKTTAIIFYEGAEKNVEIVGDFTEWKPRQLNFFDYASESKNFKFLPIEFASTSRVEYKLIVDGKWITDPLNPNKVDNGVGGENSVFTMPDYQPTAWDKKDDLLYFTPSVEKLEIESKIYGKQNIQVFIPFVAESSVAVRKPLPVMYLQDGSDYVNRAKAIQIQQNLVKAGKIKPFIMVFLDPKDRMKEYWANDNYAKFLATEVVPAIDKQYKTIKSRDGRAILGASLGGVTSVHTAIKYPEIFGRVGGQSSSFWIDNERVVRELETLDAAKNKFVFYLDTGTLEGADDDRKAVEILRKKGFDVTYEERETGHNWTSWRDRLADAYLALWSGAKM